LYSKDLQDSPSAGVQERRGLERPESRSLGHVIACDGAKATVTARVPPGESQAAGLWSVGRLVTIAVGRNRVVALTRSMQSTTPLWSDEASNTFQVQLELVGEVRQFEDGSEKFSSGISAYPHLGANAHQIRSSDLMRIYDHGKRESCIIGKLSQDESIDAAIHMPSMLNKHFAIVGSTGSGKSTAVSLLLREAVKSDPKLRVLILDPHNEFAAAFPDTAVVIETGNLDLPFWLFRLDEFAEVIFRGRPPVPEELDVLRDLIPEAKRSFRGAEVGPGRRVTERNGLTADTPVPYRIADLMALIDERIGKLDGRSEKPHLRSIKLRLAAAINDPRYKFMFSSNTITDTINETIASIFRIPGGDRPISTFQLAGIPSEVVNSVASVLCRMAFEIALWSKGAIHILVVCEEAHRYVPSDPNLGFFPTRQAIARIAKEGRKYGVSLGIVTQRPGELDQTILSQCSTVFSLRLANDRDQEIIGKALPDSSASSLSFISSLANGEAIAFGEAVPVPMRLRFNRVKENVLPTAHGADAQESDLDPNSINLATIVERMRSTGGPDISEFQSRVSAAEASVLDAVTSGISDSTREMELPVGNLPHASPALEPYVPGMLPGQARVDTTPGSRPDTHIDRYSRLGGDPKGSDALIAPGRPPAGDILQSRRESLLRKPLDSLLKR
jgi:DNA helicase HerA-like ATPase